MVLCEYLEMYFSHNTIPQEVLCYTKKHRNLNVTQLFVTHKTMYHGVVKYYIQNHSCWYRTIRIDSNKKSTILYVRFNHIHESYVLNDT